jgi:catechol 2,3-dioxygenase-like lactoylglutathione lyase family enzyme
MKPQAERSIIQVAHVVRDLEKAIHAYSKVFGVGPWDVYTFAPPVLRESMYRGKRSDHTYLLAVTWVGGTQLELMQPLTGYSCYDEFLERKGEGLHHIKERVDDCQEAIADYARKGIQIIQSGKFGEDEFYYLDTEPVLGVIIELGNNGKIPPPERRLP